MRYKLRRFAHRIWLWFHGPWRRRIGNGAFDELQHELEIAIGWRGFYNINWAKSFTDQREAEALLELMENLEDRHHEEEILLHPIAFGWVVRGYVVGVRKGK